MQIQSLDVRLLTVFASIRRHKSLTLAAQELGLSQPALSQSLAKLRKYFNDPLFVRTPRGMEATPRALELADAVDVVLATVKTRFERSAPFDPLTSKRVFSFYTTDLGAVSLLPALIKRLKKRAPGVRLRTVQLSAHDLSEGLESGDVDLAIGVFPDFGGGIYQQRLYRDAHVCLMRAGHPLALRGRLTRAAYLAAQHVMVSTAGTGHGHGRVEKQLQDVIPAANIVVRVPSFLAAPFLIRDNDLLLTLPRRTGGVLARDLGLKSVKLPLELSALDIHQYWHERFHHDPVHRWFRGVVAELFMKSAADAAKP